MTIIYVSKNMYDSEKNELREGGLLLEATIEGNQVRELKRMSLLDDPDDEDDGDESSSEEQDKLGREVAREIMGITEPIKKVNQDE